MAMRLAALLEHLFIAYSAISNCPVFRVSGRSRHSEQQKKATKGAGNQVAYPAATCGRERQGGVLLHALRCTGRWRSGDQTNVTARFGPRFNRDLPVMDNPKLSRKQYRWSLL